LIFTSKKVFTKFCCHHWGIDVT